MPPLIETYRKAILFSWFLSDMVLWEWLGRWKEYSWNPFAGSCQVLSSLRQKNIRRKTSILQWFQNLTDWPLWILKVRCECVLIHVTLDTNQPISALLSNNYHSKQASKLVTHVFINTRTSLTKDIRFPRISRIQWLTTVNDIQTSDVKWTKLKTILQVESPSIRRLCSYGTAPSWMLLIPFALPFFALIFLLDPKESLRLSRSKLYTGW